MSFPPVGFGRSAPPPYYNQPPPTLHNQMPPRAQVSVIFQGQPARPVPASSVYYSPSNPLPPYSTPEYSQTVPYQLAPISVPPHYPTACEYTYPPVGYMSYVQQPYAKYGTYQPIASQYKGYGTKTLPSTSRPDSIVDELDRLVKHRRKSPLYLKEEERLSDHYKDRLSPDRYRHNDNRKQHDRAGKHSPEYRRSRKHSRERSENRHRKSSNYKDCYKTRGSSSLREESRHRDESRQRHESRYRAESKYSNESKNSNESKHSNDSKHRNESKQREESRHREESRQGHVSSYREESRHRDRCREESRYREESKHRDDSRHREMSRSREDYQKERFKSMNSREARDPSKPRTAKEKILEDYRKNFCQTSDDFIKKLEEWCKEKDAEEAKKMWFRCSPADLYYCPVKNGQGVEQMPKLQRLCEMFFTKLIERGRKARPEVDELPPLNAPRRKCRHGAETSSSSSSDSEPFDEEKLAGYSDRIMVELSRKQNHPRRLHPELWFNNPGEMNGGPLCRCSARARRTGMRHGVYAGENSVPKCIPHRSNVDKLYHYRITVSPPTNFLIKAPTIIGHDEHEFVFSGFSMFSHHKLVQLPTCTVIRFNIEYTILYEEEPAPPNFTVRELDLFEEYLFYELLELVDLDLGKATETSCSQFHFMPRFVRMLPDGGAELLSMCEVMKYLVQESNLLISPEMLKEVHKMDHYSWQKFVDRIKGMIVTYPGKKPCSLRVDQLDRSPPPNKEIKKEDLKTFYPEIVHFGIRPPQLSYAGNPEYQKAWRYYVKYRHLVANMAKPTSKERQKLLGKEARLQDMRTQAKMKRDVTVAVSSKGSYVTGLMCDVVQHAMLIPVLVRHLRFHKSLDSLEKDIGYVFTQRSLLQTALTHPSYRENFGTNPDHARNTLTNCGIRQPEYGNRKIHYTRKKGIVTLINIMSRFGNNSETESEIKHNERLEFLGDAVVEFLSSIHLFLMFPGLAEGGLATYRAAIVQNQHLALLAKNIDLCAYMLFAHGSDLCREVVMKHAAANCFEALMAALYLDGGIQVADKVFALALWRDRPDLMEVWLRPRLHPLQEQEPLGDRKYIKDFEFLQRLTQFEELTGIYFKHIRLLARAFTDRSVGFTHLTLGSNQRLEFLGDTVLQLIVSSRLYRHFPDHHEGHLSLLRSSLVNNRTQAQVCDDLGMSQYAIYNNPKAKPTTKKHKADLLESFLGALYIDKNLEYCDALCNAVIFPRLQEFILNQDWNDPKSKLQQCCLTLRSMEGGEPDIPVYKVIKSVGPTNTRVYSVAVYFRGLRLAVGEGHSIQEAEMNAAEIALAHAHELFPQLDHQKRVIANTMKDKKSSRKRSKSSKLISEDQMPKAYREKRPESESESEIGPESEPELGPPSDTEEKIIELSSDEKKSSEESEGEIQEEVLPNVQVTSLLTDMENLKKDLIQRNEYDKLKEKAMRSDSDGDCEL